MQAEQLWKVLARLSKLRLAAWHVHAVTTSQTCSTSIIKLSYE